MYKKDRTERLNGRATIEEKNMLEKLSRDMGISQTEIIWRAVRTYYSQRYKNGKFLVQKDT